MQYPAERKKEGSVLESQAGHQEPELRGLESRLHCTVEGVQSTLLPSLGYVHISDVDSLEDVLLVRFTHLDPFDETRDFSIVIDVSDPVYKGNPS